MRARETKRMRRADAPAPARKRGREAPRLTVRLSDHVTLEAQGGGTIVARVWGHSDSLGTFSANAVARAQALRVGVSLAAIDGGGCSSDKEMQLLVRRLAARGLIEYRVGRLRNGTDQIVIEPQAADYWPQPAKLDDADILVLSRFAYLRRRGNDLVMESPRAQALFRICDPGIAGTLATLVVPQPVKQLRRQPAFGGLELLGLLADCQILFKIDRAGEAGLRPSEGDASLVLWDFHDLLFHTRSTQGRHANPLGGTYPYAGAIAPLPAVRPRWPGKKIGLDAVGRADSRPPRPDPLPRSKEGGLATLLRERHSTRVFDDQCPITLAELARFLDSTARVQARTRVRIDFGHGAPTVGYAMRPYPSGGAAYELELYLAVGRCEGLARGFYHYDAGAHALAPIAVGARALDTMLQEAEFAMGAPAAPQILITIAARFGRTAWKYSSIAYALVLKDVGVLLQTLYLAATGMGLGGCAIGSTNIDLFAKMTGIAFHIEGPVGVFAMGRGAQSATLERPARGRRGKGGTESAS